MHGRTILVLFGILLATIGILAVSFNPSIFAMGASQTEQNLAAVSLVLVFAGVVMIGVGLRAIIKYL